MDNDGVWDSIVSAFEDLIDQVIDAMPRIFAAVVVLLVGIIVAKLLAEITKRLLGWIEQNKYIQKAEKTAGLSGSLAGLAGKFLYWVVFVIFFSAAVDVLELQSLSDTVDSIVSFAPNIFAAAFVFAIAYLGSVILRDLVRASLDEVKFPASRAIGIIVQVFILLFGVVTAVAQLGLDLTLLNNNITVVVAGLMLGVAAAFGFGGKKMAASYVTGLANKKHFKKGQKVTSGDVSGKIKSLSYTTAVVETKDGEVVVSYDSLVK